MTYLVNEIFYTLQGEGFWTGRPAVFVRFSGCNLWTGLEADRTKAICTFCDTDFTAYTEYTAEQLVAAIDDAWQGWGGQPMVVFTGGEPALQLDRDLIQRLGGWYLAVETNGTKPLQASVDWVCVSPKTPRIRIDFGNELKFVYPQKLSPETFEGLQFDHLWISPMDGPNLTDNTNLAVEYVLEHPQWRLNIQTHKAIGLR